MCRRCPPRSRAVGASGAARITRRTRSGSDIFVSYIMDLVTPERSPAAPPSVRTPSSVGGLLVDGSGAPSRSGRCRHRRRPDRGHRPDLTHGRGARAGSMRAGLRRHPGLHRRPQPLGPDARHRPARAERRRPGSDDRAGRQLRTWLRADRPARPPCRQHLRLRPVVADPWTVFGGYLDALDAARPAVNVAALVAHGTLRLDAMADAGRAGRRPTEQAHMARLLDEALDWGAVGLSTGLEYPIEGVGHGRRDRSACARASPAAAGCTRPTRGTRTSRAVEGVERGHRDRRVARASGSRSRTSLPRPGAPAGRARPLDGAHRCRRTRGGLDVAFDIHTRLFGFTNLSVALPRWVVELGPAGIRRGPRARAATSCATTAASSTASGSPATAASSSSTRRPRPEVAGRSLADLAAGRTRSPHDVIFDVLAAHADRVDGPMCIGWSYTVDQIARRRAIRAARRLGRDRPSAPTGRSADHVFHGAYTWAAWYLETVVRERRRAASRPPIHRLTGPARRADRPRRSRRRARRRSSRPRRVRPGRPSTPTGTFEAPNRLADGIRHVITNGVFALEDGPPDRRPWRAGAAP